MTAQGSAGHPLKTQKSLFLTHSSDLISTYYSTGDVYFIDQSSGAHNQAHRLSDINDKHHEVASLIGQNLGLFAVGKKIVFVEGEESSIDRLTYQKIAQTVNADIRVIPTGSVLTRISDLAPLTARVYTLTRRSATISPPERGGG